MDEKRKITLTSITVDDLARLFGAATRMTFDAQWIRDDIDAGAPTNADGTMHLIEYVAWLIREEGSGGDRSTGIASGGGPPRDQRDPAR